MKHSPANEKANLRSLGLKWLKHAPVEQEGWPYVWLALWRHGRFNPELAKELRQRAVDWLKQGLDHRQVNSMIDELRQLPGTNVTPARPRKQPPGQRRRGNT